MILAWLYDTGVVLDGNPYRWQNRWQNSDQALKMMKNKRSTGAQFRRCGPAGIPTKKCGDTRRCPVQKVRSPEFTLSKAKKRVHVGFIMFGSWFLAHRS